MKHERQDLYWDSLAPVGLDAAVIDPKDHRGQKNRYLANIRNVAVVEAIGSAPDGPILDFGCGSGSLTEALAKTGRPIIGVDISAGLLARSRERALGSDVLCVHYDGRHLPIIDATIAAITTYVVLTHIIRNEDLSASLRELIRVLQPGGRMILIEQVRATSLDDPIAWKRQRSIREYLSLLVEAGFKTAEPVLLRHGRSPWVQLARLGLLPSIAWPFARRAERIWSGLFGVVDWDYADALIMAWKPDRQVA